MVIRASGSTSIMISMSLSGLLSPHATEPNNAACLSPRCCKACSETSQGFDRFRAFHGRHVARHERQSGAVRGARQLLLLQDQPAVAVFEPLQFRQEREA